MDQRWQVEQGAGNCGSCTQSHTQRVPKIKTKIATNTVVGAADECQPCSKSTHPQNSATAGPINIT